MSKKMFKASIISLCMLLVIVDTKTAVNGAVTGIYLCIRVLIPSLFPFFLISILLTDLLVGTSSVVLHPLGKLLKIPAGSESLFLVGMIGGYPVGAQIIAQSAEKGVIDKRDAVRMMRFCNNAGPAFIFGVISSQFPRSVYPWLIWIIIVLSSVLTAVLSPGNGNAEVSVPTAKTMTLTQAMEKSMKVMAGVCGWVVIFRVILAFLERWFLWMLPDAPRITIQMLLELANGCTALNEIESISFRFIISIVGLCIGGFCVLLQTLSVSGTLGIGKYIPGKLLQTGIAILFAIPTVFLLEYGTSPILLMGILLSIIPILIILSNYRKKCKIKCRIPVSGSV